ncbi:MAG TPA: helix-turn-helix domain-containing protein [Bryobacteraceae bacterium]|nr:helix-turn-helix domain-containing protein [Bryobacteraceae bacterium]
MKIHNGCRMPFADPKIAEWSERFRKHPLARSVVAGLRRRSAEIWQRTFELLQRESPEYRNSVDDEFTKESRSHCGELLRAIIAVSAGKLEAPDGDPFAFVRTHAQWRAQRQVPLIASLHAYRLAHKTYWGITHQSLLRYAGRKETIGSLTMLSGFWIEFFDHVGAILEEAHAEQERLGTAQNTRAYAGLMDDLLRGREPGNAGTRRLATFCGIRPGSTLALALARAFAPTDGKQMDLDAALRSTLQLIQQVLPPTTFGKLADIRNDEVTVIVSAPADTARGVIRALRRHGFGRRSKHGLPVAIGVSLDTTRVAGLPEAVEEARLALDFAGAGQPLSYFGDIDLADFLIRRADQAALRLIPTWSRHIASNELAETIRAFAECSLNVKQTARHLGVHTNTVYFRLNRIQKITGVDPRAFSGAVLLVTVLRMMAR